MKKEFILESFVVAICVGLLAFVACSFIGMIAAIFIIKDIRYMSGVVNDAAIIGLSAAVANFLSTVIIYAICSRKISL